MLSIKKLPMFFASLSTDIFSKVVSISTESSPQSPPQPEAIEQFAGAKGIDRFACEIVFAFYPQFEKYSERFIVYGTRIVSTVPDLTAMCNEVHDIFDPHVVEDTVNLARLKEGIYIAYIQGDVFWEHNINPEFGTDDGEWVFNGDDTYPRYIPLSVKEDGVDVRR